MAFFKAIPTIRLHRRFVLRMIIRSALIIALFGRVSLSAGESEGSARTAAAHSAQTAQNPRHTKQLTVTVVAIGSGSRYTGTLLTISDSLLVLWQSSEPWSAQKAQHSVIYLRSEEIDTIVVTHKAHLCTWAAGSAALGAAVGAFAGLCNKDDEQEIFTWDSKEIALMTGVGFGACGAAYAVIRGLDDHYAILGDSDRFAVAAARLRPRALFPQGPPAGLDLPASQPSAQSEFCGRPAAPKLLPRSKAARFHLMLGASWMQTPANDNIVDAFHSSGFGGIQNGWFGPIEYPIEDSRSFCRTIGVDFSLTPHFRLGLATAGFPPQKIIGRDWENESASSNAYGCYIAYLPRPACPELCSRFEWALGAGIGYHALSVNGVLSSVFGIGIIEQAVFFKERKRCIGAHFRGSVDYYLSRKFSLQLQGEARVIPRVNLPLITYRNPYNQEEKKLAPHSVNFSGLGLTAGLRFHI